MSAPLAVPISVIDAMADPALFGHWFSGQNWATWRVFLSALFALPMTTEQLEVYRQHTGRTTPPVAPAREAWLPVGRRGGKDRIAALVAVFLAAFRDYSALLAPGERGVVMVLAADRRQARVAFRYIEGLLDGVPMLAKLVERRTKDAIYLTNGIVIEIHTASFRAVRGYTIVAAICSEVAFWRSEESANPDVEIIGAIRPAMATVPGALLLAFSSPYARRGVLWEAYRQHYAKDVDPILVWQADTRSMNPNVDEAVIADAYARDEAAAAAEYGAEFRRDVESFVQREAVEACIVAGRRELPPVATVRYIAFVDPSGGSADSMTLAIAHREPDGMAVLDAIRERKPPFSPEAVVVEFADLLKLYRTSRISGDRYAGEWPREAFRKHGIAYEPAAAPKSDLYTALLPIINSGKVALLDVPRLIAQLCSLERRTAHGGRDTIDHPPHQHDDLSNSAAGALVVASVARSALPIWSYVPPDDFKPVAAVRTVEDIAAVFARGDELTPTIFRPE